jgi:hypothetical protein
MDHRRWRWLWLWVGVLVAGCGQMLSSGSTPPATREPTLSLLGYTLLPSSLTPSPRPNATVTPVVTVSAPVSQLALYLQITGAACYETPVGSLICLGQVRNTLSLPVEQVQVEVQLLARDGKVLAAQAAFVSRWMIPTGEAGPYRVLFERVPDGYTEAYAFVRAGEIIDGPESHYATTLALKQVSGAFVLDQYQITLSVINKSSEPVEQIAVTMILLDRDGRVTGFRRMVLDPSRRLSAGESLTLSLKVIPQGPDTVTFDSFAEGIFVSN